MSEVDVLNKIHDDLEILKHDMAEIKQMIKLEPELKEEIKKQVEEARARIAKGEFVSNEDILKEFEAE